jgi:hypothetical protein
MHPPTTATERPAQPLRASLKHAFRMPWEKQPIKPCKHGHCTITIHDIVIPEFCPLLGIRLEPGKGTGGAKAASPSLDKIRPELGYVPGNVWVISHRANVIKSDATLSELRMLVERLGNVLSK